MINIVVIIITCKNVTVNLTLQSTLIGYKQLNYRGTLIIGAYI